MKNIRMIRDVEGLKGWSVEASQRGRDRRSNAQGPRSNVGGRRARSDAPYHRGFWMGFTARQIGAVAGQNGTKSFCPPENQGKSREIKPPRGNFFRKSSGLLRIRLPLASTRQGAVQVVNESYDNGLVRSRSLGPRGLLALPRLLSPPPRRLKSTNLSREFKTHI
jgi:hypothetical protein